MSDQENYDGQVEVEEAGSADVYVARFENGDLYLFVDNHLGEGARRFTAYALPGAWSLAWRLLRCCVVAGWMRAKAWAMAWR